MEFLHVYDCSKQLNRLSNSGNLIGDTNHIVAYFIQPDVHDFDVFRVINGTYDEDYEHMDDRVMTVEHQKICKYEVLESCGIPAKTRFLRDKVIDGLSDTRLIEEIIRLDVENGFENWDYKVCESRNIQDAISIISEDGYYKVS